MKGKLPTPEKIAELFWAKIVAKGVTSEQGLDFVLCIKTPRYGIMITQKSQITIKENKEII